MQYVYRSIKNARVSIQQEHTSESIFSSIFQYV